MNKNVGTLYVVATPIGHLADISLRAIEILKKVNWIAAEDTRHSAFLLNHYAITTPTLSLHEHNEHMRSEMLLTKLQAGDLVALISDAGTPLISDPGYFLVRAARLAGIRVVPIPGACALIAALCASGLATDQFIFMGFLPAKTMQRKKILAELKDETKTLIFYEAPHRILATLKDCATIFGEDRFAVIARELTKMHETISQGSLSELMDFVGQDDNQQRGEQVLLIAGQTKKSIATDQEEISTIKLLTILLAELPLKQAVALAVKISGGHKNAIYQQALKLSRGER